MLDNMDHMPGGDDAERSDAEERRVSNRGDDAASDDDAFGEAERGGVGLPRRSDAKERRVSNRGDDAEPSDAKERRVPVDSGITR
ncbi:hypothetical protein [Mycobacterium paraterrae]|uniref:Uncharacterized protein n=1 Tax=Mycobacterium paraterrae TaxID=577492 RepID=A0ABY3VTT1_9MYCO|nr:hypothetical protein [Mycobacterium paraterrae]UMB70010.1 hypothetical protein MKK62_01220 [Mycobacterium paraterrae]